MAVPAAYTPSTLNPAAEVAAGPGSKVKQAAEKLSGQGALAPDVEGQTRKCISYAMMVLQLGFELRTLLPC